MRARLLALFAAALLAGCEGSTELMLVVRGVSPLTVGAGADIDTLRISVQPADEAPSVFFYVRSVDLCPPEAQGTPSCRPQRFADPDYDGGLSLPVRFLLQPGSQGGSKPVRVWVDALKSGYAKPRLANGVIFRFVAGRRLWLEVPLYRQCLDFLECQKSDQVCGATRDCTSVTPGNDAPVELADLGVDDFSVAGEDLPPSPDLGKPCGAISLACCAGGTCPTSGTCNGTIGLCQDPSIACGQLGQTCCSAGPACVMGSCMNGSCAPDCGDNEQACCTSTTACFRTGSECFVSDTTGGPSGTCHACGATNQRCCPGSTCGGRNLCGATSTCTACGATNQPPCTTGLACDAGLTVDANGLCNACGGTAGAGCCAGPTCNSPSTLTCEKNVSGVASPQNLCRQCGQSNQYCCSDPGATPCGPGLACNGTLCEPCGYEGGPCCATGPMCDLHTNVCSVGVCSPCGGLNQTCCTGNVCNPGLTCQGGVSPMSTPFGPTGTPTPVGGTCQ